MVHATQGGAAYRVDIVAGGHGLVADEGPGLGGHDAGPDPFDLVLAGLAACTLITLRMYAERTPVTLALKAGFTISTELTETAETGSPT